MIYSNVYTKSIWADDWILSPYLEPLQCSFSAGGSPGAKFRYQYGGGYQADGTPRLDGLDVTSGRRLYIQIRTSEYSDYSDESVRWTGWIPTEDFKLLGDNGTSRAVDQVLIAQDLITLLETRIDGAWVNKGEFNSTKLDIMPVFNKRFSSGGGVIGNRSSRKYFTNNIGSYIFSSDAEEWTNYDILEYIITWFQDATGPTFELNVTDDIKDVLENMTGLYNLTGKSVRQAIDMLLPKSQGLIWWIWPKDDIEVEIYVQTTLDEELTVNGFTMPANDEQVNIDLWTDEYKQDVMVRQDASMSYDTIIVRGAKMKTCFTFHYFLDSFCKKGWSDATEASYLAAASGTTGYGDLSYDEKATKNDQYRSTDQFANVFNTFRISDDWNWVAANRQSGADVFVSPAIDDEGNVDITVSGEYWNVDKKFLSYLPFLDGYDYSGTIPVNNNPTGTEPEERPIMSLTDLGSSAGPYAYVDKLKPDGASVRAKQRGMAIEVKMSPAYLMANADLGSAEPGSATAGIESGERGIDYRDTYFTVMMETDQVLQVKKELNPDAENKRTLVIDVPDAELWYVTPGTVVDVDSDGALVYYGCDSWIRDDTTRLKQILASAVSYYGKRRNKLKMTIDGIGAPASIGQLITNAQVVDDGDTANGGTVVTGITFDFQSEKTTLVTDGWPLAFGQGVSSGGGGSSSTPSLKSAGKTIDRLEQEISEIRAEVGKSPVRIPSSGGSSDVGKLRRVKTQEAWQDDGTVSVMSLDKDGLETGDAFDVFILPEKSATDVTSGYWPVISTGKTIWIAKDGSGDWTLMRPDVQGSESCSS